MASKEEQERFARIIRESVRQKYGPQGVFEWTRYAGFTEQMPPNYQGFTGGKVGPREINPRPAEVEPEEEVVVISPKGFVTLPRRGRLGDQRIVNEHGLPIRIEQTQANLSRYLDVSDNFDRINGYG